MTEKWKEFLGLDQTRKKNQEYSLLVSSNLKLKSQNEENTGERTLQMRIELDSWSPVYKNWWDEKYREKLSPEIFKDQGPVENLELNSYVDHDISIEKLIASTKDKSMKVYQEGNTIFAEIKERENDPLLCKVFDLVDRGIVTSNSFIFKAIDAEVVQRQSSDVIDVIFTKGELISIDPVYAGFYPQAETQIITKEVPLENVNQEREEEIMKDPKDIEEPILENANEEKIEEVIEQPMTLEEKKEEVEMKEIKLEEITTLETREKELNKIDALQSARNNSLNETFNVLQSRVSQAQEDEINLESIHSKWRQKELLNNREREFLKQEFRNLPIARKEEIAMILGHNKYDYDLVEKSLDGTSDQNGLVLIEILTNPNVFSEMQIVFPELTSSTSIMALIGLNEVKQPILIPNSTAATPIKEGQASTLLENTMTKVTFKPVRYSLYVSQNNQLNNFNVMLEKQTLMTRNSIFRALRKAFYDNILKNIGSDLNPTTYDGGATQEAVVQSQNSTISWDDLELIYKRLVDLWGDSVKDKYMISMHVDTLTALEKTYFDKPSTLIAQLYNPITREYRGIKINATSYYPTSGTNTDGKFAAIFYLKEAVMAYGCNIVTQDDKVTGMSEDQAKRFVRTRGEIKMCDPNLNTRVLKLA